MELKTMKKIVSILIILSSLVSLTNTVFATEKNQTVQALVNTEIKFEINGEEFIPTETDGTRVFPLTYNDRTYIPARFVAENIGLKVTWNGDTNTVGFLSDSEIKNTTVSAKSEIIPEKYYTDVLLNKNIDFTFDNEKFTPTETDGSVVFPLMYNDRTYMPARFIAEKAGVTVTWNGNTNTVGFEIPKGRTPKNLEDVNFETIDDAYAYANYVRNISYDEDYMILQEDLTLEEFHKQALRNIILVGFEYYDRPMTRKLKEFPSYAEVYSYYMQNKENKSEKEIVDHLNKVYSMGTDAVKLFPYKNSTELYERVTSIKIMTETNPQIIDMIDDKNNGTLYNLKYLRFYKGKVLYDNNSAFKYINPLDKDSTFAFELDFLMEDYQNYITYYLEEKEGTFWMFTDGTVSNENGIFLSFEKNNPQKGYFTIIP